MAVFEGAQGGTGLLTRAERRRAAENGVSFDFPNEGAPETTWAEPAYNIIAPAEIPAEVASAIEEIPLPVTAIKKPNKWYAGVTIGLVTAVAGLIIGTNAQLARLPGTTTAGYSPARRPQNLAELVLAGTERNYELTEQVDFLTAEIANLSLAETGPGFIENASHAQAEGMAVGSIPVTGPGVTVILDDAPSSAANIPGVTPDDLVIHQQDLQQVIAALWAGGAEAMTLMGERVTMTSAFRCTGNVLLLHGRVFSPPYVVSAIGDPDRLRAAVLASEGVQVFLDYVEWLGLGFSVATEPSLTMPAYVGPGLVFAQLPPETNPFR